MYAVIFKAEIEQLDEQYSKFAEQLHQLATNKYHCIEFTSVSDNHVEISISYWQELEHIKNWKKNAKHLAAQELGATQWYKSYQVEIVKLLQKYSNNIENQ